jgi:hypothetical protein
VKQGNADAMVKFFGDRCEDDDEFISDTIRV